MNAEILNKVIELAAEQIGVSPTELTVATHFINDLNFDSLDVVEFGMEVEDQFEISVPDEDLQKLLTIGDVVTYIEKAQAASTAQG